MAKKKLAAKSKFPRRFIPYILLLLLIASLLIPFSGLKNRFIRVGKNPWSIKNRLILAEDLFNHGQPELAQQEINLIEASHVFQLVLKIRPKLRNEFVRTKNLVYSIEKIQAEIDYWLIILEEKPDYLDAYLRLAVLNYQLKNDQTAQEYWQKAEKLDPNGESVKEVKELINQ